MNGEAYIDLLGDSLIPTVHLHGMTVNWIFQQDNATCHTAHPVKEWFEEEGIEVMTWPAQSPDINPIENLWDYIAKGACGGAKSYLYGRSMDYCQIHMGSCTNRTFKDAVREHV